MGGCIYHSIHKRVHNQYRRTHSSQRCSIVVCDTHQASVAHDRAMSGVDRVDRGPTVGRMPRKIHGMAERAHDRDGRSQDKK